MSTYSNTWSWKDRFYAFLLRRALGPILTPQSAIDLHRSIDAIDWSTGKLALFDVRLDPVFLTSAIHQKRIVNCSESVGNTFTGENGRHSSPSVVNHIAVHEACIGRCAIHLSLCNIDQRRNGEASSTARKVTSMLLCSMFGTNNGSVIDGENDLGMALQVHIEIEGLNIVFAPGKNTESHSGSELSHQTNPLLTHSALNEYQEASPPPGFFSKLFTSVMKSLRLSVDISKMNIRLCSQHCINNRGLIEATLTGDGISENERASWVELHVSSVKYYDLIERNKEETLDFVLIGNNQRPNQQRLGANLPDSKNANVENMESNTKETLAISKALDWEGVFIDSGETVLGVAVNTCPNVPILQSFNGELRFRVFEKWSSSTATQKSSLLSARQDIEVSLGQRISIEFSRRIMTRVIAIAKAMAVPIEDNIKFVDACNDDSYNTQAQRNDNSPKPDISQNNILSDEFSKDAYDKIMKQYVEERHLARTRELRGGLLVPSFDERDQCNLLEHEGISFDAFFDANDHSFSYYSEIAEAKVPIRREGEGEGDCQESYRCMMKTRIEFSLREFTVKTCIESLTSKPAACMKYIDTDQCHESEFVLFSMGDIGMVATSSIGGSMINCCVSHFDIECQVNCGQTSINEHILLFHDYSGCESSGEFLVSSPPCISLMADVSTAKSEVQNKTFQLGFSLLPVQIMYHERAFQHLQDFATLFNSSNSSLLDDRDDNISNLNLSASCKSIVFLIPCETEAKASFLKVKSSPIFRRHGYINQGWGGRKALSIGVELDNISVDLSHNQTLGDNDTTSGPKHSNASFACHHMIIFATASEIERGRKNRKFSSFVPYRADLMALTGDGESGSSIVISYSTQMVHRDSTFPIVLPLSSTKARQELDETEDGTKNIYSDSSTFTNDADGIHAQDPQYVSASEASKAKRVIELSISHILFDCTTCERECIVKILSHYFEDMKFESSGKKVTTNTCDAHDVTESNALALAINVDQISIILHGPQMSESNSYSLILDKVKVHTLIGYYNTDMIKKSGVRNFRFLCHDFTLYELTNFTPTQHAPTRNLPSISCDERCRRIRARLVKSSSSSARALLFRQKLYQTLSPETPSILLDILFRGDEKCDEKSFHVAIYDMTYRYIMHSEWAKKISNLLGLTSTSDDSVDASPSIIHLSVNLTDCNIDYTPSRTLKTPSRLILRVGESRLSSNIVSPCIVQSHKLSSSDLRVYLCNHHHSYNEENSRLSCAQRHLQSADIFVHESEKCLSGNIVGLDDGLCRMGFVNVAVLDVADVTISKYVEDRKCQNDPSVTLSLTMGKLSIYACKDSFSCLISTYSEWFIMTTALSDEELDKLKRATEARPETAQGGEEAEHNDNTREWTSVSEGRIWSQGNPILEKKLPSSIGQHVNRDDIVSLDLTKLLLFQNYYTFDTVADHTSKKQFRRSASEPLAVNRKEAKPSIDDDWATVEHDFIQYSKIPRDRDFTAEWITRDTPSPGQCSRQDDTASADSDILSQSVKVYPQHIPLNPISHSFSDERTADPAQYAGFDINLPIGIRVIIKDATLIFHFFDGSDWVHETFRGETISKDRKKELLGCLVNGIDVPGSVRGSSVLNNNVLLPEERNARLQREIARRKLRRNTNKYFQIIMSGLKLRNDSYSSECQEQPPSSNHLASSLALSVADFFISETISTGHPLKMIGEWVNETEHPRDSSDGIITLRMRTKHPRIRLSSDGKLMSDESRASLEILPLRCCLNQNTLRFVRNFFAGETSIRDEEDQHLHRQDDNQNGIEEDDGVISDDGIIDIFFELFQVKSCKLKVDYQPERMDIHSFREGNFIELLNICPLEDMILSLKPVEMSNLTGWGSVINELSGRWLEDICSTQAHKFVTRASPFQPFSNLSDPLAELALVLVVPEGSLSDYFRGVVGGTTVFAGQVLLEALSTSAKLTRFAANQLNRQAVSASSLGTIGSSLSSSSSFQPPRRPRHIPRNALDTTSHAYESIAHGLSTANYKIVTVPLREYQTHGATGAARSALRGIPVGVLCPIAGASEALSYTLLGLRNQLRPDIWKEEEASLRGLDND